MITYKEFEEFVDKYSFEKTVIGNYKILEKMNLFIFGYDVINKQVWSTISIFLGHKDIEFNFGSIEQLEGFIHGQLPHMNDRNFKIYLRCLKIENL